MDKAKLKRIEEQLGAEQKRRGLRLRFVYGDGTTDRKERVRFIYSGADGQPVDELVVHIVETEKAEHDLGLNDPRLSGANDPLINLEALTDEDLEKEIAEAEREISARPN